MASNGRQRVRLFCISGTMMSVISTWMSVYWRMGIG